MNIYYWQRTETEATFDLADWASNLTGAMEGGHTTETMLELWSAFEMFDAMRYYPA